MMHLDTLRRSFARFLIPLLWTHVLIVAGSEIVLAAGIHAIVPIIGASCLAAVATLLWMRDPVGAATRIVSAIALIGMAALLLAVFVRNPWQVDLHMYFFACLAVLVGWCDWRVILAATATTAIHHLALDLVMPVLVFPGGTTDVARVLLHAAIVMIEAGVLMWVCRTVALSFAALAASERQTQEQIARTDALENEAQVMRSATEDERRTGARNLADAFETTVGDIIGIVLSSAEEMEATAQTLNAAAARTAGRSTTVAASAEEAANNVNTVAVAAEQLGASVQEIGRQVDGSANLALMAVSEADRTGRMVQELSSAVSRIGNVVGLISSIAGQTNGDYVACKPGLV